MDLTRCNTVCNGRLLRAPGVDTPTLHADTEGLPSIESGQALLNCASHTQAQNPRITSAHLLKNKNPADELHDFTNLCDEYPRPVRLLTAGNGKPFTCTATGTRGGRDNVRTESKGGCVHPHTSANVLLRRIAENSVFSRTASRARIETEVGTSRSKLVSTAIKRGTLGARGVPLRRPANLIQMHSILGRPTHPFRPNTVSSSVYRRNIHSAIRARPALEYRVASGVRNLSQVVG